MRTFQVVTRGGDDGHKAYVVDAQTGEEIGSFAIEHERGWIDEELGKTGSWRWRVEAAHGNGGGGYLYPSEKAS